MQPLYSASECIPWLVVLIIECLAIVILNIITIVVFVKKKRQLQRRSTYLIIHLAIVDLLVGAVSGPLRIEMGMSQLCLLWNYRRKTIWSHRLSFAFVHLFSFISLTNLIAVSLERLHATLCPFRHRFVRKWVYRAIIIVIWLIPIVREAAQFFFYGKLLMELRLIHTCISHFMQFLYLLSVYLTSSLLSKYDVVVILNSILDQKEKEN